MQSPFSSSTRGSRQTHLPWVLSQITNALQPYPLNQHERYTHGDPAACHSFWESALHLLISSANELHLPRGHWLALMQLPLPSSTKLFRQMHWPPTLRQSGLTKQPFCTTEHVRSLQVLWFACHSRAGFAWHISIAFGIFPGVEQMAPDKHNARRQHTISNFILVHFYQLTDFTPNSSPHLYPPQLNGEMRWLIRFLSNWMELKFKLFFGQCCKFHAKQTSIWVQ